MLAIYHMVFLKKEFNNISLNLEIYWVLKCIEAKKYLFCFKNKDKQINGIWICKICKQGSSRNRSINNEWLLDG